ncbi:hypothetical protein C8Q74DRAFT_1296616 [Fomes fomentarius]|nr:hypothetical protein C8Q74DRAFT_1296616 [Fomes fomentarius]
MCFRLQASGSHWQSNTRKKGFMYLVTSRIQGPSVQYIHSATHYYGSLAIGCVPFTSSPLGYTDVDSASQRNAASKLPILAEKRLVAGYIDCL